MHNSLRQILLHNDFLSNNCFSKCIVSSSSLCGDCLSLLTLNLCRWVQVLILTNSCSLFRLFFCGLWFWHRASTMRLNRLMLNNLRRHSRGSHHSLLSCLRSRSLCWRFLWWHLLHNFLLENFYFSWGNWSWNFRFWWWLVLFLRTWCLLGLDEVVRGRSLLRGWEWAGCSEFVVHHVDRWSEFEGFCDWEVFGLFEVFFGEHVVEDVLSNVGHVPFFELAPVYVEECLL